MFALLIVAISVLPIGPELLRDCPAARTSARSPQALSNCSGTAGHRGRVSTGPARWTLLAVAVAVAMLCAVGCSSPPTPRAASVAIPRVATTLTPHPSGVGGRSPRPQVDVYAHTRVGMLSPATRGARALVYVPNVADGTVSVIDQARMHVIDVLTVGREPQHVVPSWDLRTLWVNNNRGNSLSPIDPRTGKLAGPAVPVRDPYNLYFTPDGSSALVMAEALGEIDFYDPRSWRRQFRVRLDTRCRGVNHVDFSPDGSYFIATCEFSGQLVKVDVARRRVLGYLDLRTGRGTTPAPQDIKVDPSGAVWYVADMNAMGVHEIDGSAFRQTGFLPTGPETHGLYPSRDGHFLYVANRGGMLARSSPPFPHSGSDGSVSVIDVGVRRVVATWSIPGGGTPDMGNVSADGSRLWLSGRRNNEVYVFDTGGTDPTRGHLLTRIPVGREPHGLAVWPLPGRYSLGHTGILR